MQVRATFVITFLALASCVPVTYSRFQPRSAAMRPVVTPKAIMAYQDDVQQLVESGGEVLGTVIANGDQNVDHTLLETRACIEAARYGATHVLMVAEGFSQQTVTAAGSSTTTATAFRGIASSQTTFVPPHEYTISLPKGSYLAVRVPQEAWGRLPNGLRPAPGAKVICLEDWQTCPVELRTTSWTALNP